MLAQVLLMRKLLQDQNLIMFTMSSLTMMATTIIKGFLAYAMILKAVIHFNLIKVPL